MKDAPEKIWVTTGLYYAYEQDWSEGEWQAEEENVIAMGADSRAIPYVSEAAARAMVAKAREEAIGNIPELLDHLQQACLRYERHAVLALKVQNIRAELQRNAPLPKQGGA